MLVSGFVVICCGFVSGVLSFEFENVVVGERVGFFIVEFVFLFGRGWIFWGFEYCFLFWYSGGDILKCLWFSRDGGIGVGLGFRV